MEKTIEEIRDEIGGNLYLYATAEYIRAATEDEILASYESGDVGAILVDGVTCYVAH